MLRSSNCVLAGKSEAELAKEIDHLKPLSMISYFKKITKSQDIITNNMVFTISNVK